MKFSLELEISKVVVQIIHQKAKMTGSSEDFLCEDDFDTVLGIIDADMLESNKDFIQERVFFIPKVNQSESLMNPCTECAQICILKGGLTRHNKKKNSKSF